MRQPPSFLRTITTGDAQGDVDGRAMPAFVSFSISLTTASRTSPYSRRRTGCLSGRVSAVSISWNVRLVVRTFASDSAKTSKYLQTNETSGRL